MRRGIFRIAVFAAFLGLAAYSIQEAEARGGRGGGGGGRGGGGFSRGGSSSMSRGGGDKQGGVQGERVAHEEKKGRAWRFRRVAAMDVSGWD